MSIDFCNPFRACDCGRSEWTPIQAGAGAGSAFVALAAGIVPALILTVTVIVMAIAQRRAYAVIASSSTGFVAGLAYMAAGPDPWFVGLAAGTVAFGFAVLAFIARDPDDHALRHGHQPGPGHGLEPRSPGTGVAVAALLSVWLRAALYRAERRMAARAVQRAESGTQVGWARYTHSTAPPPPPHGPTPGLPPPGVTEPIYDVPSREGSRVRRAS